MRPAALAAVAVAVAVLGSVARGGAPPVAELVAAVRRGDPVEIERVGRRLGTKGILAALSAKGRDVLYAALEAAPRAETPWMLLPRLGELLTSPDRPLAAGAARAMARITRRYGRDALLREEVPPDEIARVAGGCGGVARQRELWPDVRIHALECATALAAALGEDAPVIARGAALALLEDPDAQLRRAAAELLAPPADDAVRQRLAALTQDPDAHVAASAMAALCVDDPRAAQRLLGEGAAGRAAALARTPDLDRGTAAMLKACARRRRR